MRTGLAEGQQVDRSAAAEALFNEGLELLDHGEWERASVKLRASQNMDPGVGTLMYLAECYRRLERYASAWTRFLEAAALARSTQQLERAALAQAHADELAPLLSRVTIQLSPQAAQTSIHVRWGGLLLQPDALGSALPVDPGSYPLEATAPGAQPFHVTAHVRSNGEHVVVRIPALLPAQVKPRNALTIRDTAASRRNLHPVTWALGALTLAGAGVGTAFAIRAEHIESDTLANCKPGPRCPPHELDELDRAQRNANVAYASFVSAGVALLSATAWELYTRRPIRPNEVGSVSLGLATSPIEPRPGLRGAHLILQGRFD